MLVWIPAPYIGCTLFKLICCKIVIFDWKDWKYTKKMPGGSIKKQLVSCLPCSELTKVCLINIFIPLLLPQTRVYKRSSFWGTATEPVWPGVEVKSCLNVSKSCLNVSKSCLCFKKLPKCFKKLPKCFKKLPKCFKSCLNNIDGSFLNNWSY